MSRYTEEMVAVLEGRPVWTYADVQGLASDPRFVEAGASAKSIASKIRSMAAQGSDIAYERKPERVNKRNEPVVLKPELVSRIEVAGGFAEGSLSGLAKATKATLETLAVGLGASVDVDSSTEA